MTEEYKEKLKRGEEFQDFIADYLRTQNPCIIITTYASRKYQYEHGENANGIEIKYDKASETHRNLYFETEEKSKTEIAGYSASGIFRDDNTWLYLIGNDHNAWIFSKKQLQAVYKDKSCWNSYGVKTRENGTSRGFTIPIEKVDRLCLRKYSYERESA